MKRYLMFILPMLMLVMAPACKRNDGKLSENPEKRIPVNPEEKEAFYKSYPEFKAYAESIDEIYDRHENQLIWYDKDGRIDFAEVLYSKARQIEQEGVPVEIPYVDRISKIFEKTDRKKPTTEEDLLITGMYFFYADKVFGGLDAETSKSTGWYLPRNELSYVDYLDRLMEEPDRIVAGDKNANIGEYYLLRKALTHYRNIEKNGGWPKMQMPEGTKNFKNGDEHAVIAQVRNRLFLEGDLKSDSKSAVYDDALQDGLDSYFKRHYRDTRTQIGADLLEELSIPVSERIKTILVNMERCRWVPVGFDLNEEYVAVNIPAYQLKYWKNGEVALESNVVVGKEMHKTVVFTEKMSYLVFSPYWNVPRSILNNEIQPALEKDPGYLEKNNMEWNGESVRQKPGPQNSLGLVKFMFPNQNNIYLHDSPAKSLFTREERAFSHGCIRVHKAKELAYEIMEGEKGWNEKRIDAAMNKGTETYHTLSRKIPVFIAYFTAWPDEEGRVSFYEDIYKRDDRLAKMLYR